MIEMESVDLRTLRQSPRYRVIDVNDNILRMFDECEEHQKHAMPNERFHIGHDQKLGTFVLFSTIRRVK